MVCTKCGATIPDGWPNCLDCGSPAAEGPASPPSDTELFPLLAAANLSRIRGAFQDAERRCTEILNKFPNHAAPHSLLGEIYEDQGRFDDAITWYQLALELDPTNEQDRSLLERATKRKARMTAHATASSSAPQPAGPAYPATFQWLAVALLVVICLGLAVVLAVTLHHGAGAGPQAQPYGAAPSPAPGAFNPPTPPPQPVQSPPPNPAAAAPTSDETQQEQEIQAAMSSAPHSSVSGFNFVSVQLDPRAPNVTATVTVATTAPLPAAHPRDAIIRIAGAAIESAGAVHIQNITIRILGSVSSGPSDILFVADASTSAFAGIDPRSLSANDVSRLQNAWWSALLQQTGA